MLIKDILKIKGGTIYSIAPQGLVTAAVDLMVSHDIGSLVVMDGGEMVGMLTFREILCAFHEQAGQVPNLRVADIMVREPVIGHPSDTVDEMRGIMTDRHVRYLPIKEEGKLLGVISFHDVAKAALKAASFENRLLKQYIKNWPEAQ
jgi:CBS domain-containing protein